MLPSSNAVLLISIPDPLLDTASHSIFNFVVAFIFVAIDETMKTMR